MDNKKTALTAQERNEIIRRANIVYFRSKVWNNTYWMGIKTAKCPLDLWIYQELIADLKPDFVIETGTAAGGSALFFAQMMDLVDHGQVITVDIERSPSLPEHSRIEYVTGSSVSSPTINRISNLISGSSSIMVILDSDHHTDHKLREMELYGQFVNTGNYMIVEDSCFDEFPAWPEFGPGPAAAIKAYLSKYDDFITDKALEKHLITFAPRGFLKKIK